MVLTLKKEITFFILDVNKVPIHLKKHPIGLQYIYTSFASYHMLVYTLDCNILFPTTILTFINFSFFVQFKYAKPLDIFLIVFGLVLAFGSGSAMPIMCIMFGDVLQVGHKFMKQRL